MKHWRWLAFSLPATFLYGWSDKSQAADILIEFEVATTTSTVSKLASITSKTDRAAVAESQSNPDPNAHLLNFAPPPITPVDLAPQAMLSQTAEALPTNPISSAPALEDLPLPVPEVSIPTSQAIAAEVPPPPLPSAIAELFAGNTDSLVARAVGTAEGTRTPDGQKTFAYYGHLDPGNQAWNQGTFSYQHAANSPEEADEKQLARLKRQTEELYRLASNRGLRLNTEEALNGIDLANQAPMAALDRGYIDWLAQAKTINLSEQEAILWARTRAFLDPDTGRWNAPGLENSVHTITQDQARRQRAIAQALAYRDSSQDPISAYKPAIPEPHKLKFPEVDSDPVDSILRVDLPN
ncbi:MAG: hypothetical protein ACFBSF_10755 [Leptolyngbyaceae cyanobacterium]